jgi:FAD synthase
VVPASQSWTVRGVVVPGERRGRQLGYPTANVSPEEGEVPADGVYAAHVVLDDDGRSRLPAAVSVGTNPTFEGAQRTVEAHLLYWDGDLYGQRIEVHGTHWLRSMAAFESVAALLEAMADDVARARALLNTASSTGTELHSPAMDLHWTDSPAHGPSVASQQKRRPAPAPRGMV